MGKTDKRCYLADVQHGVNGDIVYREWLLLVDRLRERWNTSFIDRHAKPTRHRFYGLSICSKMKPQPDMSLKRMITREIKEARQGHVMSENQSPSSRYLYNVAKDRYHKNVRSNVRHFIADHRISSSATRDVRQVIFLQCVSVHFILVSELETLLATCKEVTISEGGLVYAKLALYRAASELWIQDLNFDDQDKCPLANKVYTEIHLDIHRTFGTCMSPSNITALRNVLVVLGLSFPSVGYCQSLNFIAARVLTIFDFHWQLSAAFLLQLMCSSDCDGVPIFGNGLFPVRLSSMLKALGKPSGNDQLAARRNFLASPVASSGPGFGNLADTYGEGLNGIRTDQALIHGTIRRRWPSIHQSLDEMGLVDGLSTWLTKPIMTLLSSVSLDNTQIAHLWDFMLIWGYFAPGNCEQSFIEIGQSIAKFLKPSISKCYDIESLNHLLTKQLDSAVHCCDLIDHVCVTSPLCLTSYINCRTEQTGNIGLLDGDDRCAGKEREPTNSRNLLLRQTTIKQEDLHHVQHIYHEHRKVLKKDEDVFNEELELPFQYHGEGRARHSLFSKPYRVLLSTYQTN